MLSVAVFSGEFHTRWTCRRRMTVVHHFMITRMLSGAWTVAGRLFGATRNRWIHHICTTFTVKFIEGTLIAWETSTCVTSHLRNIFLFYCLRSLVRYAYLCGRYFGTCVARKKEYMCTSKGTHDRCLCNIPDGKIINAHINQLFDLLSVRFNF